MNDNTTCTKKEFENQCLHHDFLNYVRQADAVAETEHEMCFYIEPALIKSAILGMWLNEKKETTSHAMRKYTDGKCECVGA